MRNIKRNQEILREKHSKYADLELQEITKKDLDVMINILDICEYYGKKGYEIIRDFYVATMDNETFGNFLINYDCELELLGEKYLISIGAIQGNYTANIDFENLEYMEYWEKNYFVDDLRIYLIDCLKCNDKLLDEILDKGSKNCLDIENKEEYIVKDLEECFEYIKEFNNNGYEVKFDIDEIIYFTLDNIAECVKEYIENGYKNEWDLPLRVSQSKNDVLGEKNESIL